MPTAVTLAEAQSRLGELIGQLAPGEELVIFQGERPVARLIAAGGPLRPPPGLGRGSVVFVSPDFDAPLEGFEGEGP